jgi:DNA-binding HxlR family transcriptional regulator
MGTGYGQFCPVAAASEVLAERWTPLVVRELMFGSTHFNDLRRGLPLMSPTLLARRLRELETAGVVERRVEGRRTEYRLTRAGHELGPLVDALARWGDRWGGDLLAPDRLDPRLLIWYLRRMVIVERLPQRRTVIRFELTGPGPRVTLAWLVVDGSPDVCLIDPGFEVDLEVEAPLEALVRFYLDRADLGDLVREGVVRTRGPRPFVRGFPTWFRSGWDRPGVDGRTRDRPSRGHRVGDARTRLSA